MKTGGKLILALACALALSGCTEFFSSFAAMVIRTVSFEENGGSAVADLKTSLIPAMPVSTRFGYALEGWYTDATFAEDSRISFPYDPLANVTLHARWLPATEGLLYEANGTGYMVSKDPNRDLSSEAVVIPSRWLGKPVTNVAGWGFENLSSITSVVIPETVSTLGTCAFSYCTNLQNVDTRAVTPPPPATKAFLSCTSLISISVPPSSLAAYQAADGWKAYASKMTTDNLSFSKYAVSFVANGGSPVSSLSTTLIPDVPVSSKFGKALEGWYTDPSFSAGTKVSFPYDPLADATLYAKWINATEGLGYSQNATGYSVSNYSAAGAVVIPEYWQGKPVTAIEGWAFNNNDAVSSIVIPATVTEIGPNAFQYCDGFTSLTLPPDLTSIGANAFRTSSLASIIIPSKVGYLGNAAFCDCASLASVQANPATPPVAFSDIFGNCPVLTAISVPSSKVAAYQTAFGWSTYSSKISSL